jgi:hypothetical protein
MKKAILIIACISLLYACKETPCDVKEDINKLEQYRSELRTDVQGFGEARAQKVREIDSLNGVLKIIDIYKSGRTPRYVLKLHLKQSHITLDLGKVIKDHMNAIDFEIPVDKQFYDEIEVGTSIVDKFRSGSMWMEGSFGNWEMTVSGKEIR